MKKLVALILALTPALLFSQVNESDSLILVEFYMEMNGDNWSKNENWLSSEPLETWKGITVEDGRVTELKVSEIGVQASIPESIYDLDSLSKLDIANFDMTDTISHRIYNLSKLNKLTIRNCGLTGEIPSKMDTFTLLSRIIFSSNDLTGNLPNINNNLTYLDVNSNELSGEIPTHYINNNFSQFNVMNNQLVGSYDMAKNWYALKSLKTSNNNWDEHNLPVWLDDLPNLSSFSCWGCQLIGEIPEYDWSENENFYQFLVTNNELYGDISRLQLDTTEKNYPWINIADNAFEGEFPAHLLKNISKFFANGNNFSTISEFDYNYIGDLYLYNNQFPLSEIIKDFPSLIQDPNVYQLIFDSQRTPYDDEIHNKNQGETLSITADGEVEGAIYTWYKFSTVIEGENEYELSFSALELDDAATYRCDMTHPDLIDDSEELVVFKGRNIELTVNATSNINESELNISIQPNPASDFIEINCEGLDANFEIYNTTGQLIDAGSVQGKKIITIENLLKGSYYLKILSEDKLLKTISFLKM